MEIFSSGLLQRALLEVVILGATCGALGVWLLHLRHTYAAESLAHAMLPGLVDRGARRRAAAARRRRWRARRRRPDRARRARHPRRQGDRRRRNGDDGVRPGRPARARARRPGAAGELLFGDLLGTSTADLITACGLGGFVALALCAGHRPLAAAVFDPLAAPSLGVRPARVELALLALLALAVVAAVQGLGNLLVLALIVAPAAAAIRLGRSVGEQISLAAALGRWRACSVSSPAPSSTSRRAHPSRSRPSCCGWSRRCWPRARRARRSRAIRSSRRSVAAARRSRAPRRRRERRRPGGGGHPRATRAIATRRRRPSSRGSAAAPR